MMVSNFLIPVILSIITMLFGDPQIIQGKSNAGKIAKKPATLHMRVELADSTGKHVLEPGDQGKMRVVITNTGEVPAAGVQTAVSAQEGITVDAAAASRTVPSIVPGDSVVYTVPFTASKKLRDGSYGVEFSVKSKTPIAADPAHLVVQSRSPETVIAMTVAARMAAQDSVEQQLSIGSLIRFRWGSAEITKLNQQRLDLLAQTVKAANIQKIIAIGHSDTTGSDKGNIKLARKRALYVRDALVQRGLRRARISVEGMGSSVPVAPSDTKEGQAKNRRVCIIRG